MPTKKETTEVSVQPLKQASARLRIVGTTPLFQNRMANKVKETLLVGGAKKGKADRVAIKHDPIAEYRNSAGILPAGPTALGLKVTAVKGAMATAALETPGLTKSATQRLLFMPGDLVPLYGTPQLRMALPPVASPLPLQTASAANPIPVIEYSAYVLASRRAALKVVRDVIPRARPDKAQSGRRFFGHAKCLRYPRPVHRARTRWVSTGPTWPQMMHRPPRIYIAGMSSNLMA